MLLKCERVCDGITSDSLLFPNTLIPLTLGSVQPEALVLLVADYRVRALNPEFFICNVHKRVSK